MNSSLPAGAERAVEHFRRAFGPNPTHLAIAPGRVNLIGEHTDYQNGFVFPAAIDRYVFVAASISDGVTRLVSGQDPHPVEFTRSELNKGADLGWGRYPAGMAWAMGAVTDVFAAVESTLPLGAGLSSSAAIEMAFGCLYRDLGNLDIDDPALARLGQKAENEFAGMNCGIMDQTASLFGRDGHALFIDTAGPGKPIAVPLPSDLALVVCDTRVKHALQASDYNTRRSEVEAAARALDVPNLREATFAMVEVCPMEEVERRRARHVVSENTRVRLFREALEGGDYGSMGALMRASHESLRDDFQVSCPELDAMAEAAWEHPACVGARMTGGGFGGSCIALVRRQGLEDFLTRTGLRYLEKTGIEGAMMTCRSVDGARTVKL